MISLPLPTLLALAAGVGAVLTSFGRLAAARLPHQLGWRDDAEPGLTLASPPSRCDACRTRIRWRHLLPVLGWCLARGRCPDCRARISPLHPIVETIGGLSWVLALWWFGTGAQGWAACLLWQVLLFLAEIDWREAWLPAVVTLPLFWVGLLLSPFEPSLAARVWGAFAGFALMWLSMAVAGRWRRLDTLSGGDIALAAAAGAWLGLARLPAYLLLASLLFTACALPARRRGHIWMPMGPALCLTWLICLGLPEGGAWPL
ncbi:MAG: prepilin peptidase [Paludibacterium sp.]|uniref:prepilin peptidase n=1 Tax=Paludibacterium sp. TaxID=1917523 RepID=UPI0025D76E83|nr:A24 family peptidase [Paludibacterium sp.]MBV8046441.1 prepilin peptidase [Paludibacterium sp.]MBV8645833.1 prepilin peptidase [Paludibacterium sp.]